ncbi:hypothetical protein K504DRAFT_454558 [Pleomassaria siparia CBS 279.74]|uniref:Uncharacterized protein n=1 Tax=Pleomassaria siparia CBS 279.74 TaxID=1314801 RepID=A0A6G1KBT2_9PLEO|nr:hypothetical protein K504DRAFT_454558 [Pleomassaria siparia CBS 279.74]
MNWTGGTLQRHKVGQHNGIAKRQREHFAKVRQQLQHGASKSTSPSRPNYPKLYAFKPPQEQGREGSHTCQDVCSGQIGDGHHAAELTPIQRTRHYEPASPRVGEKRKGKKSVADAEDDNDKVLEAKRRRLLQEKDWVGLAPSRPVNMHFGSTKDKARIGKRRKVEGRTITHSRYNGRPLRQSLGPTFTQHAGPYMSEPLKRDVEDIRIRIGTDALTTQTSMQQDDDAESPNSPACQDASSDCMLLDYEHLYTAPSPPPGGPIHSTRRDNQGWIIPIGRSTHCHIISQQLPWSEEGAPSHDPGFDGHGSVSYSAGNEKGATGKHSIPQTPTKDIGFNIITHGIGGVECPVRYVFDGRSDVVHVGEGTHSLGATNAGLSACGHAEGDKGDKYGNSSNVGRAPSPLIVDDGPWRAFVGIGGDSLTSRSTTTGMSRCGVSRSPQLQHKNGAKGDEGVMGSQHATLGDHGRMRTSSIMSASLALIKRGGEGSRMDQLQSINGITRSEEPWQSFVLGGGYDLKSNDAEHVERDREEVASRKPILPMFPRCSVSDDAQRAANCRPVSTCSWHVRAISSPVDDRLISGCEAARGGPLSVEHELVGEEDWVVTQASIVNNGSSVSKDNSNIPVTLYRNCLRRRGPHIGPSLAKRSEPRRQVQHESPVCDIPVRQGKLAGEDEDEDEDEDEGEEGIDLVDPYRTW